VGEILAPPLDQIPVSIKEKLIVEQSPPSRPLTPIDTTNSCLPAALPMASAAGEGTVTLIEQL